MLYRFYGVENFPIFKTGMDLVGLVHGNYKCNFPFGKKNSITFKGAILQVQKTPTTKKPNFYLSAYLMDVVCASFSFPTLGWHWIREIPHTYSLLNYMGIQLQEAHI